MALSSVPPAPPPEAKQGDCLVIGCGYLGQRVAALWRTRGRRVFATTRRPERAAEFRRLGLEPVLCDVLDPASLRGLPAVETAVHCVGLDRASGRSMQEVYVDGLANVLAALAGVGLPERFLHVSSTSVYGQGAGEEVDETAATEPPDLSGQVILQAERLLQQRLPGAVVLRFAGIYGPGRLIRVQTVRAGEPLVGDPDRWLNLIHVEDGAAAVLAAEEHGRPGAVYNVADGRPVRRCDFYRQLARVLGAAEPRFVPLPPGAPVPAHERTNRRVVSSRLREELGLTPRYPSFEEGLEAALAAEQAGG